MCRVYVKKKDFTEESNNLNRYKSEKFVKTIV